MVSFLFLVLVLSQLSLSLSCSPSYHGVPNPSPEPDPPSPASFTLTLSLLLNSSSSAPPEPLVIEVHRDWAPLGADRFYSLLRDGFYDCAAFFRVVPDFVVQFGIAAEPSESAKWNTTIPDDPVVMSNVPWTVSFATAGPDTRTTQIFINYVNNSHLDALGFAPFGMVTSGFDAALSIVNPTPGNSNGIDQDMYYEYGNDWILEAYPNVSLISSSEINNDDDNDGDNMTLRILLLVALVVFGGSVCFALAYFMNKQKRNDDAVHEPLVE